MFQNNNNEDSDQDDEGFIQTKIQIQKQKPKPQEILSRPTDFQARYITGNNLLKKQPIEIYSRFDQYLPTPLNLNPNTNEMGYLDEKKYIMDFDDYFINPSFKLIYSRNNHAKSSQKKGKSMKQTNSCDFDASNQINLSKTLVDYQPENYSVLKNNQQRFLASQTNQAISQLLKSISFGGISNSPQQQVKTAKQLEFDSKFEGGNLLYAFKHLQSPNSYHLFMQNDTNTIGYNQWFYFTIKNAEPNISYRFHILNFKKRNLLFKDKMKISVFSLVDALKKGKNGNGWRKMGENIKYTRSPVKKIKNSAIKNIKYYCLSFSLSFQNQNDYISIAMNPPYTYSRLIHNLKQCYQITKTQKNLKWQLSTIAHTIANNSVPYITLSIQQSKIRSQNKQIASTPFTVPFKFNKNNSLKNIQKNIDNYQAPCLTQGTDQQPKSSGDTSKPKSNKQKMLIFLARQHPGQTWSSFLMEQILYYLVQKAETKSIGWLLQNYVIKIFPMINVDGVIYGNFRCDLGGFDLNRTWKEPHQDLHPQIFQIKKQIQKLSENYQIQCVFDLHGHSKQYNVFCYSCQLNKQTARILPKMISNANSLFHFPFCTFGLSKYKQSTARAVIHRILNNQNVLTIQNSFYGMKIDDKYEQFEPKMIKKMAESIIETLVKYLNGGQQKQIVQKDIKNNLKTYIKYQFRQEDSGSDSDPYEDQIPLKQKIKHIFPKSIGNYDPQKDDLSRIKYKKKMKNNNQRKQKKNGKLPQTFSSQIIKDAQIQYPKKISPEKIVYKRNLSDRQRKSSRILQAIGGYPLAEQQHDITTHINLSSRAFGQSKIGMTSSKTHGFSYDKPKIIPVNIRKDSVQLFRDAYMANNQNLQEQVKKSLRRMNQFNDKKMHNTIDSSIKKIQVNEDKKNRQLPMLCIFSDSRKQKILDQKKSKEQLGHHEKNQRIKIIRRDKDKHNKWGKLTRQWKNKYSNSGMNVFFGDLY